MLHDTSFKRVTLAAAVALAGCAGGGEAPDVPDPGQGTPTIEVSPRSGTTSTEVSVRVSGIAAGERVEIGFGPPSSEYDVLTDGVADAGGGLTLTVDVPNWADADQEYVFVADAGGPDRRAVSEPFLVRAAGDVVLVTGVLTEEGVECPALRGDNGRLYTLTGDLGRFDAGDRVEVRGEIAEMSMCMQGTTLAVQDIGDAR